MTGDARQSVKSVQRLEMARCSTMPKDSEQRLVLRRMLVTCRYVYDYLHSIKPLLFTHLLPLRHRPLMIIIFMESELTLGPLGLRLQWRYLA